MHFKNTQFIGTRRGTSSHLSWQELTGSTDIPPPPIPFNETTGPATHLPPTASPIQFYEKLVDETVMSIIIQETNQLE